MSGTFEEAVPQVFVSSYEKTEGRIRMTFDIGHWAPIPFGLVYWDDLACFEVRSCTEGVEVKPIQDRMVFLRFQLTGEPMKIELTLEKR